MTANYPQLTPAEQAEIIGSLCDKLQEFHVFPEIAGQQCELLKSKLKTGKYSGLDGGSTFTHTLTMDLWSVVKDEHLWVRWSEEVLPDDPGSLYQNPEWLAEFKKEAESENYGFLKVEILEGNVGYIDIRHFYRLEWAKQAAVDAMAAVAGTEALILDVRHCPGGNPDTVTFLSSYLFDENPVHLNSLHMRAEGTVEEYWTLPDLPGKRYLGKPVYVLIGKDTFSGGEDFAYSLQAQGRVTLVGEQTDGGAHLASLYRLHPHVEASIPVGRAINPVTGNNWQEVGVAPDVTVPVASALDDALLLAWEELDNSPN